MKITTSSSGDERQKAGCLISRAVATRLTGKTHTVLGWPTPLPLAPHTPVPHVNATSRHRDAAPVVADPPRGVRAPGPALLRNVSASVAHDLANLLSTIGIDLDLLAEETLSGAGAGAVCSLRTEMSYLRSLTHELAMAARESEDPEAERLTRLTAWWPDMRTLLRALHREDVIIHAYFPSGLPAICINPQHLTQVVLNLVGNAMHAIAECPPPAEPSIAQTERPVRRKVEITAWLAAHGRTLSLAVSDNGAGMDPEILARSNEPYFTTRADHGGTGLGLAIVDRLIAAVGGSVHRRSTLAIGTTVTIEMPTRIESPSSTEDPSPP